MDFFQRLLRSREQGFSQIPGSFPESEEHGNITPPQHRTPLESVLRACLGVPLWLLYHLFSFLALAVSLLRPLNRVYGFYNRKNRTLSHEDALSVLIDALSLEYSSSSAGNADEQSALRDSFSFASVYGLENAVLSSYIQRGYAQLLKAASEQGKFAIIYLHNPLADDCGQYLSKILCTERFVNLAQKYETLLWFGDVTVSEGLQVANSLKVRQFPFLGLLAMKSGSKIELIERLEGELLAYSLDSLEAKLAKFYPRLIELRQQHQNTELRRLMREQQDSRFQESLRQDQERDRRQEAARQREAEERHEQGLKKQWLLWRRSVLADAPTSMQGACKVAIRTAANGRVVQKFDASLPVEEIYAYVELLSQGMLETQRDPHSSLQKPDYEYRYPFMLITPVPRVELDPQAIIRDVDVIYPSGNIVMESLE